MLPEVSALAAFYYLMHMKINKSLRNSETQRLAGLIIIDAIFFAATDPMAVASVFLIAAFCLAAATMYSALRVGITIVAWYGGKTPRNRHRLALGITGVICGLLALQTIGQLSGRDVLVLLPLSLVAYLYASYGRSPAEQ